MNTHADHINWGNGAKDCGVGAATRDFVDLGNRYILGLSGTGIEFEIDRLDRKWGELTGELTVRCALAGARTIDAANTISVARFAVSDLRARQERAKYLIARSKAPTIDWYGLLEEFCGRVLASERTGQAVVHLRDLARPGPDETFDVDGLRLLRRHPVMGFGDGGTLKSYLLTHILGTLAQRGLRVLYADWEFSGEEHRDRLERLFGPQMPDVLYVRCDRPLVVEVDRLRRIVQDEHVDYMGYDSVTFACPGRPEDAEVAAAYYRAVRSIGVGSLHIAHINKSENGDQKPFGSAFWHNGSRATWFIKRGDEAPDERQVTIGLYNRKANTGPLRGAVGFEFTFDADRTYVRRADLTDVPNLAAGLPTWQRMQKALSHGPLTPAALAEELGAKVETIDRVARGKGKGQDLFAKVPGPDGVTRIALVERRHA
jgi:hypothetical protein